MAYIEIRTLWTMYRDITSSFSAQKERTIEAHKLLNSAFIKTYDYLRNRNESYKPNLELADAWNAASAAVMKVNKSLGTSLYYKSRFWLDPQLFFDLNREEEVINLNELVDEMEKLRMKL